MTKVTITFNLSDEAYKGYNEIIDSILNDLIQEGATDVDITEDEV